MDRRLIKAAQTGNSESLLKLMEDDPLLLYKVSISGQDTPLHIASTAGHLNFVQEILKSRKEFAYEVNQDGVSPLHIASANGFVEIVKELLTIDPNLCLVRGRDRKVPLHYAVVKGRICVMQQLLVSSPDSIEEVTSRGESALHHAVKSNQFEALVILVNHLKEFSKESVLNKQDEHGNTVLHLTVSRKQYEVVDLLLGQKSVCKEAIEVNCVNKNGLTPLDILFLLQSEAGDKELEELLTQAGGVTSASRNNTNSLNEPSLVAQSPTIELIEDFEYDVARDSPSELRNTLLVVVSLIATATYQAILQPPGGIWQNDIILKNGTKSNNTAGKSVMGDKNAVMYGMFLLFNSIGFFASLTMLFTLTIGLPMQLELHIAMVALLITYDTSMTAISPNGVLSTFFTIISIAIPIFIPIVTTVVKYCLTRPRNTRTYPRV